MTKIRLIHHQHTVILQMDYKGLALHHTTTGIHNGNGLDWIKLQLQSDLWGNTGERVRTHYC